MSIGDTITEPIPPVSTPGTGYATQLKAFLEEVKARLEAKVPLSSILAGLFDLDNNAIENIQYNHLYEQSSAPTTPIGSLQNYQGNLWWVSSSGAAQLTSGNSLNAASLGAIDGDYGGLNPASLRFSDADETFYFYDDFGALKWARIAGRSIDIHGGATEADRVRITWAGSSSYTLTLPDTPPASTAIVQMDSSGTLTASNSISSPTATDYYHGDRTVMQSFGNYAQVTGTVTFGAFSAGTVCWNLPAGETIYKFFDGLKTGDRVKSVTVVANASTSSTTALRIQNYDDSIAPAITTSGAYNSTGSHTMTLNTPYTLVDGDLFIVSITAGGGTINLVHVQVVYDRPAP